MKRINKIDGVYKETYKVDIDKYDVVIYNKDDKVITVIPCKTLEEYMEVVGDYMSDLEDCNNFIILTNHFK
jgi:hypothetical protein